MPKIRHRLFTSSSSSSSNLTPAFDAVSSPSAASSPYCQLLQLTSSPSSHSYKSPSPLMAVDLEEDVLVMDGVLVSDSKSNLNSRRISFSSSSGEYGSSVSSNSVGVCKTELCRSWEELGVCRYGAKCQFAHGKEELRFELRGPRFWKQKSEVVGGSGNNSVPSAGSYCYSNRYHHPNSPPKPTTDSGITARYNDRCHPHSPLSHATPDSATPKKLTPSKTIDVTLTKTPESSKSSTFSWPPTKEEDAFITMVLYGPSSKRRLPVFEDICPQ